MAEKETSTRLQRKVIGLMAQASPSFGKWIDASGPLRTILHVCGDGGPKKNLIVLLPGIQDQHRDFELSGFIGAAREQGIDADLLAVDAHIGYYVRETILERLRRDVILPARERGYENIWLAGTSLGGLGSILYAAKHGSDINGVFMMAPFLGDRALIQQIEKAGGPPLWTPGKIGVAPFQMELWKWLKAYLENPEPHPRLYLGFGTNDRFARANQILAEQLPKDRVITIPGGHNWQTWAKLWTQFVNQVKGHLNQIS